MEKCVFRLQSIWWVQDNYYSRVLNLSSLYLEFKIALRKSMNGMTNGPSSTPSFLPSFLFLKLFCIMGRTILTIHPLADCQVGSMSPLSEGTVCHSTPLVFIHGVHRKPSTFRFTLATIILFFASMCMTLSDTSFKWSHNHAVILEDLSWVSLLQELK